jgi:hypothetical protein
LSAILLLFACASSPDEGSDLSSGSAIEASKNPTGKWTAEAALAPTLDAMDRDGNGVVQAAEYRDVQGDAPGYREVDLDGNGVFDISELLALTSRLDPQTWDGNDPRRPMEMEVWRGLFSGAASVRQISEWMRFQRAEIAANEPGRTLPSDQEIQAAALTEALDSPEVRAVLDAMKPSDP